MGGFVLEKFFIKKGGGPENAYLSIWFWKMVQDFLEKQNHRGASAQIFLPSSLKNLWQNVFTYTPLYLPLRQKEAISDKVYKGIHVLDFLDMFLRLM